MAVDAVDSAESGLEYLADTHPDLIFMDHLMPGLDGFEAVKRIRSNPALAHIPIVMYTSRGGDIYVGQARALGADDLLRKPPTADELDGVLERLESRGQLAVEAGTADLGVESEEPGVEVSEPHSPMPQPVEHIGDDRATGDADEIPPASPGSSAAPVGWWLAAVASVLVVWLLFAAGGRSPAVDADSLAADLQWLGNRGATYAFGDVPFSDSRLAVVERVVDALHGAGVKARVRLRAHVGQFCRVKGSHGDMALPRPSVPVESCDVIGYSPDEAQRLSQRMSPRFQAWLNEHDGTDGVDVEIDPVGVADPLFNYPPQQQIRTAGDWNRIAALNNRVEMIVEPQ